MKKSTLMMIGILVLVPMYFTAKVLLLKRHFYNGDLKEFKPVTLPAVTEYWDKKNIGGVKYLVIDGKVLTSRSKSKTTSISMRVWPRVFIEQWDEPYGGAETLQFPKELRNVIKTEIRHDTLFINFKKEGGFRFTDPNAPKLSIHLNNILSIDTDNGTYECKNITNKTRLQITNRNSSIRFEQSELNQLNIFASSYSSVHIPKPNRISEVFFSLRDSSKLIVEGLDSSIKPIFRPLDMDSTSIISIGGNANNMKKYLN